MREVVWNPTPEWTPSSVTPVDGVSVTFTELFAPSERSKRFLICPTLNLNLVHSLSLAHCDPFSHQACRSYLSFPSMYVYSHIYFYVCLGHQQIKLYDHNTNTRSYKFFSHYKKKKTTTNLNNPVLSVTNISHTVAAKPVNMCIR